MSGLLKPGQALTMAVQPNGHGMGWVTFTDPATPYKWGLVHARGDKNGICLRRFERLITRHEPQTLILEAFERQNSTKSSRVARLCRSLMSLAADRGIEVAVYTHGEVLACFAAVGATSRHDVAVAIVQRFGMLSDRLPRKRRRWEPVDHRMALFAAAALIIAHFRLDAGRIYDGLTD